MAGSTGLEPATSGLTERRGLNLVEQFSRGISIGSRTCVSLRWLGGASICCPERFARHVPVTFISGLLATGATPGKGGWLIDLLTQPLTSRWSREAVVPRAVVPEDRALRGIAQRAGGRAAWERRRSVVWLLLPGLGKKRPAERDRVTVIRSSLDSGAREEQSLLAAGGQGWRSRKGFGISYPLAFFVGHALWQAALR
jgi:hypothetical protein